jgi:hypothetical protein
MSPAPRLLCIMGSGETTPTMVKLHRELFERLGPRPAVLLDTPYGFQSNAADISARAIRYFRDSAGRAVELAGLPRAEGVSPVAIEAAQARVAEAGWVFSGPGSPTYALRQWRTTSVPRLLSDKLSAAGCLVFSSAAALTLGRWTVPVYEIYKAGADPSWYDGLDLLSTSGLQVAVVPHYDNAEGGTHDTRYCYLGEARLSFLEGQLPPEGWVLGVDEHTACLFDLEAGSASVFGLGTVTLRYRGSELKFPAGATLPVADLPRLAFEGGGGGAAAVPAPRPGPGAAHPAEPGAAGPIASPVIGGSPTVLGPSAPHESPFLVEVSRLNVGFDDALAAGDAHAATEAALGLETSIHDWSADTLQSDEVDRARGLLRRALLRLGEVAGPGLVDQRELLGPWVEALLDERDRARRDNRYADADRIRDWLVLTGVEVRDTAAGTEWELRRGG